eukprot:424031-Hanusia_phi.AAC.3
MQRSSITFLASGCFDYDRGGVVRGPVGRPNTPPSFNCSKPGAIDLLAPLLLFPDYLSSRPGIKVCEIQGKEGVGSAPGCQDREQGV